MAHSVKSLRGHASILTIFFRDEEALRVQRVGDEPLHRAEQGPVQDSEQGQTKRWFCKRSILKIYDQVTFSICHTTPPKMEFFRDSSKIFACLLDPAIMLSRRAMHSPLMSVENSLNSFWTEYNVTTSKPFSAKFDYGLRKLSQILLYFVQLPLLNCNEKFVLIVWEKWKKKENFPMSPSVHLLVGLSVCLS